MPILTPPLLFNWRCPGCHEWRGIGSMNEAKRCIECNERCEWVRYDVGPVAVAHLADAAPKENGTADCDAVGRTGERVV